MDMVNFYVFYCFFLEGRGACFCWPKGLRARILDARFGDLIWLWPSDLNSSKISWWWHYLLTQLLVVFFHLMIVFCLKWYLITAWMNTKNRYIDLMRSIDPRAQNLFEVFSSWRFNSETLQRKRGKYISFKVNERKPLGCCFCLKISPVEWLFFFKYVLLIHSQEFLKVFFFCKTLDIMGQTCALLTPRKINMEHKHHPIEIRKIIWTKPPWLWVQNPLIFQGVLRTSFLMMGYVLMLFDDTRKETGWEWDFRFRINNITWGRSVCPSSPKLQSTNSRSHLKMDGWNAMKFPFGVPKGQLDFFGSCTMLYQLYVLQDVFLNLAIWGHEIGQVTVIRGSWLAFWEW